MLGRIDEARQIYARSGIRAEGKSFSQLTALKKSASNRKRFSYRNFMHKMSERVEAHQHLGYRTSAVDVRVEVDNGQVRQNLMSCVTVKTEATSNIATGAEPTIAALKVNDELGPELSHFAHMRRP